MNKDLITFILKSFNAVNCPKYGVEYISNCKNCPYCLGIRGFLKKTVYCSYGFKLDEEEKQLLKIIGDRFPIRCEVCGRLYITNDDTLSVCGNIKCIQNYFLNKLNTKAIKKDYEKA